MRSTEATRILLLSPTFGAYGGMEAFVLGLAEAFVQDPRFEVRVRFKRTSAFELQPSLSRVCQSLPVEFVGRGSLALWRAIRWADLVHAQNAPPDVVGIAALCRRPLVLTIHNVLPVRPSVRKLAWRLASHFADARWYNSEYCWNNWEEGHRRQGSGRVPTAWRLSSVWIEPSERRGFVFLGRVTDGKGADILVDAYRTATLDRTAWPLTIAGEGPMRAALEDRDRSDHMEGLTFVGFVEGTAKARLIAGAKWVVVPSHCREAFGLAAIEARSAGVPCIVSADGGLPEAGGRDALVCQPEDAASLTEVLRRASVMSEAEYAMRSRQTKDDLARELVPLSFYTEAYLRLCSKEAA